MHVFARTTGNYYCGIFQQKTFKVALVQLYAFSKRKQNIHER